MTSIRVAQVIPSVDVRAGGTSTAFLNVLAALRTRPQIDLHAFSIPPQASDPAWADINQHRSAWTTAAGYGRSLRAGAFGRSVIEHIDAGRFDVVHVHGVWLPDLLAIARACVRMNVRLVWQPHGMLVREAYAQKRLKKELFMALGLRSAMRQSAAWVFVTGEERDTSVIPSGVPRDRLKVVALPVEMPDATSASSYRAQARARFGLPATAPVVVFMGRLHHVKRVDMALRALALASAQMPDLRLLIVGGGDDAMEAQFKALAIELGVASRAVFAGWVQGEDKWRALASGDALTLNSLHENFGYVAVEALCVGTLPVLTSNLAIALELSQANLAVVCEPNPEALGSAWLKAIDRNPMGAAMPPGRAWVNQHLSHAAIGERLETLYQGLMKR